MTAPVRVAVAALLALGLMGPIGAGASVTAKAKKVANEKFAKVTCGVFGSIMSDVDDFIAEYAATSNDPVVFHGEAIDLTNQLLGDIAAAAKRMRRLYPDVDGGKKIDRTFVKSVGEIDDEISGALATFQRADPTAVAFQADVSIFQTTFNLLDVKISDPFGSVTDQDVLEAFRDESSCSDVVTIHGG